MAMEERGNKLEIFDVKHKKPPTLAEITLELTDTKGQENDHVKIVDWISDGIKVENDQFVYNVIAHLTFF